MTTVDLDLDIPAVGAAGPAYATRINAAIGKIRDYLAITTAFSVRYAAPWGDDDNDGLTWASAKATIYGAYDELDPVGGTVRFADQTPAQTDVPGGGIWLCGLSDPNFADPLPGWRQIKPVTFIGEQTSLVGQHPWGLCSNVLGGESTDPNVPGMWISGTNPARAVRFENLAMHGRAVFNKNSDGSEGNGIFGIIGRNFHFEALGSGVDTYRPAIHIDGGDGSLVDGIFWFDFDLWSAIGNPSGTTQANRLAFDCNGAWAMRFGRHLLTYGGARIKPPASVTWDFTLEHTESESMTAPDPTIDVVWGGAAGGAGKIKHVALFDASGTPDCVVRIDPRFGARQIEVGSVVAASGVLQAVRGPCRQTGYWHGLAQRNPLADRQIGIGNSRLVGRHDGARRQAPLASTPVVNLAKDDPTTWLPQGGNYGVGSSTATVTAGRTSPFGGTGAGKVDYAGANAIALREFARADLALAVGDFLVFGGWVKAITGSPYIGLNLDAPYTFTASDEDGVTSNRFFTAEGAHGDGWCWSVNVIKVTAIGTNPCRVIPYTHLVAGESADFYAPLLLHLPMSAFTQGDAFEIANASAATPPDVAAGNVALPFDVGMFAKKFVGASRRGLGPYTKFDFGGGTDIAFELANITAPNNTVTAVRAGAITGLSVRVSEARTGGSLTVEVTKNGTGIGLTAVIDGTNTTFAVATQADTLDTYAAGDQIGVKYSSTGPFTPTGTNDLAAFVEVIE